MPSLYTAVPSLEDCCSHGIDTAHVQKSKLKMHQACFVLLTRWSDLVSGFDYGETNGVFVALNCLGRARLQVASDTPRIEDIPCSCLRRSTVSRSISFLEFQSQ